MDTPNKSMLLIHYNFDVIYSIYKDDLEKWIVVEKCLKMFYFFVKAYEIDPDEFPVMEQNKQEYPPPGFFVMLQVNTNEKSKLLK